MSKASPPEERSSNVKRFRSFGSFLLALYVFVGALVILFSMGVWCDSMIALGMPPSYLFHVSDAFLLWAYAIPSIPIIFALTDDARNQGSIANVFMRTLGKKMSRESLPTIAALLNALILLLTYLPYLIGLSGFVTAFTIGFTVVNAGIVSVATFYYTMPPLWETLEAEDDNAKFEALKLEHDTTISLGSNVIWTTIILIASVVFIAWTQVIYPMVPENLRSSIAVSNLQASSVVQLAYLSIGIWFGILARIWEYAWRIRKEIAKLELKGGNK